MPLHVTFRLNVAPLPDNNVWFANAQAWANYWRDVGGADLEVEPVDNTIYVPSAYNAALQPVVLSIEGVDYVVVTKAMFDSLLQRVDQLNANYQTMRDELKAAGLIEHSQ